MLELSLKVKVNKKLELDESLFAVGYIKTKVQKNVCVRLSCKLIFLIKLDSF